MKFDATLLTYSLDDIAKTTESVNQLGFDGLWVAETTTDPFMALTLAAEHSDSMNLGTGIAVTFPRSPATLAYIGWNLAQFSKGRFIMGLGTQVRAHNERRFGVKWEKPVKKMRETIIAMRAIWHCWQNGTKLDVQGEFFNLNLMSPFFNPGPHDYPDVPIYIAAVNKLMLRLAGEQCDGVLLHAIHSPTYINDFALPHIEAGMAKTGRTRENFTITTAVFAVPTDDPKEAQMAEAFVKQQISFYLSTPAYRIITEIHGWEETAFKLSKMARNGEWKDMPALINDDILDTLAISGKWAELPNIVHERYGDTLNRISYYLPFVPGQNDAGWQDSINEFKQLRGDS